MKLGRLLKAASVALVPLVAGVLFLMVPASAQGNSDEIPDIRMFVEASDFREGRRGKLIFSFLDGQPDAVDRHVYLAISGTATEGSQADFTITGSNGSPLPSIGDTLYNRKIVIPAGATSAYARINVRNDNDAEQCEVIKVEGLWRDPGGSAKAFLGIHELRIPANDLSRPHQELLPSVSVQSLYPLVGVTLTATLNDPAGATRKQWTWARSVRPDGPWTAVARYTDRYTPRAEDAGHYLRAEVLYDNLDYQPACAHTVSEDRVPGNPANGSNSPPDFGTESVDRAVSKNARMDSPVGAPVTASDPDNDPLTYSLEGGDTDTFRIKPDTGQIKTNGHPLDTGGHMVTVKATDPMLAWDTVDVNIDVTDQNPTNSNGNGNGGNGNNNGGNGGNGGNGNGGNGKATPTAATGTPTAATGTQRRQRERRQQQRRRREPGRRGDQVDRRHGQLFGSRLGRRAHEGCAYPLRRGGVRRHRMQRGSLVPGWTAPPLGSRGVVRTRARRDESRSGVLGALHRCGSQGVVGTLRRASCGSERYARVHGGSR